MSAVNITKLKVVDEEEDIARAEFLNTSLKDLAAGSATKELSTRQRNKLSTREMRHLTPLKRNEQSSRTRVRPSTSIRTLAAFEMKQEPADESDVTDDGTRTFRTIYASRCARKNSFLSTTNDPSLSASSNVSTMLDLEVIKQEPVEAYDDAVDPTEFLVTNLEEDSASSKTVDLMYTASDVPMSTTIEPSMFAGDKYCRFCDKNFKRNSELNRHLLVHFGQRPYQCETCHKLFSRKSNLDRHVLTHTDERLFKCDFCEKSCRSKDDLGRHKLVHNGARLYTCYLCEKSFPIKGRLKEHLLIHSGQRAYKCVVCEKSFTKRNNLNRHTLVHTDKRDYQCGICAKSFKQKSHLIEHTTIHTGQFDHYCDICSKPFARKTNFKRHMQTHKISV